MRAYRIHENNGGYVFDDSEPRRACVYDLVNLKLPEGAVIFDFGGADDVLRRIKLPNNNYTHLETDHGEPYLVAEAIKNGIGISTNERILLEYDVIEENLHCDFECICRKMTADNIYNINYLNGKYWLDDLYERRIISKSEAMKYKAAWD